jgi:hypothetical protein
MIKKLLLQLIPIFPIDIKKVPYSLSLQKSNIITNYQDYLKLLLGSVYFVTRTGS